MVKTKAMMIGAGLANMASAVYLIQEAHWSGDQITFYSIDDHGSNDGDEVKYAKDDYWNKNHPLKTRPATLHVAVGCLTTAHTLTSWICWDGFRPVLKPA